MEKDNYLQTADQEYTVPDPINNEPPALPAQEEKPLDKVKERPSRKRSREREER